MSEANEVEEVVMPCYMMATTAHHQLGDISRDEEDLCYIKTENESSYIGQWVTGFGFVNVEFPKVTTRKLTSNEVESYNKRYVQIADHQKQKLDVG